MEIQVEKQKKAGAGSAARSGRSDNSGSPSAADKLKGYPVVRFAKRDPAEFFKTVRSRVNGYFRENNIEKTGGAYAVAKTALFFSMFFGPFALILLQVFPAWTAILLYGMMGFAVSEIGLTIMHDANHGSFSNRKWVNNLMSYSMNLIGGSSFTWKIQHNILHHSYTNIYELDEDIHDKPFLRLSPHGVLKSHHRYQHIYGWLLYTLATLSWVLLKDFRQLSHYNKTGMTVKQGFNPGRETAIMIVSKVLYFSYILVLPILLGVPWWAVLAGFILMQMVAGLIITTVFQLAHVVEGPEHFVPEQQGTMENTWAIHQLKSTANFATRSKFMTFVTGGLNHQVEHHLFPHVSHKHYQKISKLVRTTAEECGLPYYEHPRFMGAVHSHMKVLKAFGNPAPAV